MLCGDGALPANLLKADPGQVPGQRGGRHHHQTAQSTLRGAMRRATGMCDGVRTTSTEYLRRTARTKLTSTPWCECWNFVLWLKELSDFKRKAAIGQNYLCCVRTAFAHNWKAYDRRDSASWALSNDHNHPEPDVRALFYPRNCLLSAI